MSLSSISLPKPKNWQDFESHTRELIACVLNDPNTQKNGRSGQQQHGVDVYGSRGVDCLVGVQCKQKFEDQVTEKELRAEVEKATLFKPKLSEFILITTAPRDQKIQETARCITAELAQTDRPILVAVWGWEDVEEHASKHAKAWKAFDPTWNPFAEQGLEKLALEVQGVKQALDRITNGTRAPSSSPTSVSYEENENTPLHGQITAFQRLINSGHAQVALSELLNLRKEEWSKAARSERYRILVATASAQLKLGQQVEAGNLLVEAFAECAEHKNAKTNRAKGYLLKNDTEEAQNVAREILKDDESSADAAGILIQALISEATCNDPLSEVPKELHQTKEVLVAHTHFLRSRGSLEWTKLAKMAAKTFPESRRLKLFWAEAVLDDLIRTDHDAIAGGILKNISSDEFNEAVEILYSTARETAETGSLLLPSIAHNAALALRFADDTVRAKQILNAAITRFPDDEDLRLQLAFIAYSENDPAAALAVLPTNPSHPEAIGVRAHTLAATGNPEDALSLIEGINESALPQHIQTGFLAVRCRVFVARGEKQRAIESVSERIALQPKNMGLRGLYIRTLRIAGEEDAARRALDEALALVGDDTPLHSRLELSFEARRLGRDDAIVNLLKDRVATDRESEGLHALIAASINSRLWVTARQTLASTPQHLHEREWFRRADAILAINTGDSAAEVKITRYLEQCPNDARMILARIAIWQRAGRDRDIATFLQSLNLGNLSGEPEERIRIAALLVHYGDAFSGLKYGIRFCWTTGIFRKRILAIKVLYCSTNILEQRCRQQMWLLRIL